MQARFEGYKRLVARPFFRDHFARLDDAVIVGWQSRTHVHFGNRAQIECRRSGTWNCPDQFGPISRK
ncbi:MAG: YcjX family protein [Thermoanaerobaculia bacterium]|nr:YcjX family protein [Thermoanaerobaculia bacterium]